MLAMLLAVSTVGIRHCAAFGTVPGSEHHPLVSPSLSPSLACLTSLCDRFLRASRKTRRREKRLQREREWRGVAWRFRWIWCPTACHSVVTVCTSVSVCDSVVIIGRYLSKIALVIPDLFTGRS